MLLHFGKFLGFLGFDDSGTIKQTVHPVGVMPQFWGPAD